LEEYDTNPLLNEYVSLEFKKAADILMDMMKLEVTFENVWEVFVKMKTALNMWRE
jgi:hypothetical protein